MKYKKKFPYLNLLFLLVFALLTNKQVLYSQYRHGVQLDRGIFEVVSSKRGYLYKGIDNYMHINDSVFGTYHEIHVKSNNGFIEMNKKDSCLLVPKRTGKTRIILYDILGSDTLLLGYEDFIVKPVPEPRIAINNKPIDTPCKLPKLVLTECDSIGVYFSDDIYGCDEWVRITEFTIGYNYGGYFILHSNPSNILTNETKKLIKDIVPEREISIRPQVITAGTLIKQLPIYKITIF